MFQDVVHSILKDYRETERLLSEKLSKLKFNFTVSVAINDRINALMLSALVRSVIQLVNIPERQMSRNPRGKSKLQSGRWYEEGIDEV